MENKRKKKTVWIVILVVVALAVAAWVFYGGGPREVQFTTATAAQGKVEITVMATGYVQPVEKVEVGTQVSGVINNIYVDFNSRVEAGDLLAELDKLTLEERVNQAKSSLRSAEADLLNAQQTYTRTANLFAEDAATKVAMEDAANRLEQAKTSRANAVSNLSQAQVNLSYAEIRSPIAGVVLDRAVEQGQTVAASFNTPTLFTIANDLKKMQVEADVDEADIGKVKVGQKVVFTVDAYSMDNFEGVVNQVRLQPLVTNNVVTYTVIIDAPNPDEKLFPGMTANITIIAQSDEGVVVPVEALAYDMNPEVQAELHMDLVAAPESKGDGVWVRNGDKLEHRQVTIGLSDGVDAVVKSGLADGETVVLSAAIARKPKAAEQAAVNPLMPQRRRR